MVSQTLTALLLFSAVVASASDVFNSYAKPPPHFAPHAEPSYGHGRPYVQDKFPPKPFGYEYGVKDPYHGTDFGKNEKQDAYGNLEGSYTVRLPDGRVQTVRYRADHQNGYFADVSYSGEAQYPTAHHKPHSHVF